MNWNNVSNKQREVSWQARLDKKLERQKIHLNDNRVKHTGIPEDVIVIRKKKTANGDTVSKVIEDQKLINMVFPVLKDLPVRRIRTEFEDGYSLVSLVSAHGEGSDKGYGKEQKDLTIVDVLVPYDSEIEVDDTVVRVFVSTETNTNTVMIFNVREIKADFSNNTPLNLKVSLAIETEPVDLTKPSYQLILALAKRRLAAHY